MIHHFCLRCWAEIAEGDSSCPTCGYALQQYLELSYEEKLLLALQHPIRENRMMAIELLGRLGSRRALPEFEKMLQTESDFYLLREILYALAQIEDPQSQASLLNSTQHRSKLVRELASKLLAKRRETAR